METCDTSKIRSSPLFGSLHFLGRYDRDVAACTIGFEFYNAIGKREQRVILAYADVATGVPLGAALTHENVAAQNCLAAKLLHAKTATV
jgi:hypothetical protein